MGPFVASSSPKTTFIFNSGPIVGKDNMRVTYMGMKTTINPKPGHYMNCYEPLNNILGAFLAFRCIRPQSVVPKVMGMSSSRKQPPTLTVEM